MNRRSFVKSTVATAAVVAAPLAATRAAAIPPQKKHDFKLLYAPHFGMFTHHAGEDPLAQLDFMAEVGFRGLEDNGMMGRPAALQTQIGERLARHNMTMGVFVIDKGGNGANSLAAGKTDYIDIFLDGCRRAVEVAKRCNAKWMTVVPGDFARQLPWSIQTAHVVEALRRGAEIFEPHGLVMVLEPLSDTPDLYLRDSAQTYLICRAVDSPACKVLYDVYHMQKNEGHLIHNIDLAWSEIAYFQVGDNPGRKEPTTGEINFRNLFAHLYERGYRGVVGMEHGLSRSGKEGERALIDAYIASDAFKV